MFSVTTFHGALARDAGVANGIHQIINCEIDYPIEFPPARGAALNIRHADFHVRGVFVATLTAISLGISGCASTPVLSDFATDGCSYFPDGGGEDSTCWADCCVSHDAAYWSGGSPKERKSADAALRDCVLARTGKPWLAHSMYWGVRLGGTPALPSSFRWGYGWSYGRGYQPLTPEERALVDDQLAIYRHKHPQMSCEQN